MEKIGGQKASEVLLEYIENTTAQNKRKIPQDKYLVRQAYISLIIISSPDKVMNLISQVDELSINSAINTVIEAINQLTEKGGQNSGDVLSKILLESTNQNYKMFAARGLGRIKDYNSLPPLAKAAESQNAPLGDIAQGLGMLNSEKTIPILENMSKRSNLSTEDRLWIAAAMARLGKDYEKNAEFIRSNLPKSLEQAKWLNDSKTIEALENLIVKEKNYYAFETLGAIETKEAYGVFMKLLSICDPENEDMELAELYSVASRMAGKLNFISDEKENSEKAITVNYVQRSFELSQMPQPIFMDPNNRKIVSSYPQFARMVWIKRAERKLDLASKGNSESDQIPDSAVNIIELFFDKELIPSLERIVKESKFMGSFQTKDFKFITSYYVRSLAAKILTEKTGKKYTFIDADGKEHAGGWYPGMEEK